MKTKKLFGILALIAITASLAFITCKQEEDDGGGPPITPPPNPDIKSVTGISLNKTSTGLFFFFF
jgi:hypothetical protein